MRLLAIDPGPTCSAYVYITDEFALYGFDKVANEDLLQLRVRPDVVACEQIGHYGTGMPAGKEVFDTCVWIGRFWQVYGEPFHLIPRVKVKTHLCGAAKAKDGNVIQALVDRFAPGQPNRGKGTKNAPGFFYGFHSDIWQSMALAVYYMDTHNKEAA